MGRKESRYTLGLLGRVRCVLGTGNTLMFWQITQGKGRILLGVTGGAASFGSREMRVTRVNGPADATDGGCRGRLPLCVSFCSQTAVSQALLGRARVLR